MKEPSNTLFANIELNAASSEEKIRISPIGDITGVDGRAFRIDAESLIRQTKEKRSKVPLLIRHGYDPKYGGDAAGWIDSNSLEIREDGIYATLERNQLGEELISQKRYGMLSPAFTRFYLGDIRVAVDLVEVSLENEANFPELEINHAKELNTMAKQNEELQAQNHALRVDLAIEQNRLLPKDRALALELNASQLEKFISSNSKLQDGLNRLTTDNKPQLPKSKNHIERAVNAAGGK